MKILLDECVPRKLKRALAQHTCQTVPEAGFAGRRNGEFLALAEQAGFDVFLTLDKGIEYEQNLGQRKIAIVVFLSKSSRLADLLTLVPAFTVALSSVLPGQLLKLGK
ncbi:MAG: DUF5615 family PIN-like protein [Candidatus Acidiferrum sp.]